MTLPVVVTDEGQGEGDVRESEKGDDDTEGEVGSQQGKHWTIMHGSTHL